MKAVLLAVLLLVLLFSTVSAQTGPVEDWMCFPDPSLIRAVLGDYDCPTGTIRLPYGPVYQTYLPLVN